MKFKLDADEQSQLDGALASCKVRGWFKAKENMKFEIGDVLVKYISHYDYGTKERDWKVENINSDNKMAQRYVYIHEDENGIGYLKQLKVSTGTLGKELFSLIDFDYEYTRFEVDPEYAEHTLLDADFDIQAIHKKSLESRKIASKMNRKLGIKPVTIKEHNDFFNTLNVGDVFYTTTDYTGRYLREYTILKVSKIDVKKLDQSQDWWWRRWKEKNTNAIDDTYTIKLEYKSQYGTDSNYVLALSGEVYYKSKPVEPQRDK